MLVDPALRVCLAELDQFLGEFAGEEQVAQELAVHRVGAGVEDLSQQPQIARTGFPGSPVVLAVYASGDLADRQGVLGRDEDVRHGLDRFRQPARLLLARSGTAVARASVGGREPGSDQRVGVGERADVLGERVAERGVQQVRRPDVEVGLAVGGWQCGSGRRN